MQIACKKFGCQKAVEVCYWTCKYRRNCKDWAGALAGQPGLRAITERLEAAAAKSGRLFEARTLLKPGRPKRAAAAPVLIASSAKIETTVAPQLLRKKNNHQPLKAAPKTETKPMAKLPTEEEKTTAETTTQKTPTGKSNEIPAERKVAPKTTRPKTPSDGTVYLLLSKNGKYKELRESDLIKEAATILKDSSLRLVKGQYLVPYITFKSLDE